MPAMSAPCRHALTAFFFLLTLTVAACHWAAALPEIDENYRLQSGDVVLVTVLGEEKMGGSFVIGPGGTFPMPLVGNIFARGHLLREVRAEVARLLRDVLREPYVTVALDETACRRRVNVMGHVDKPGALSLPFGSTVSDALMASGLGIGSDLSHVRLRRSSGETLTLDCTTLRTGAEADQPVLVQWDDTIYVPLYDSRLTIVGQVQKPGSFTVPWGVKFRLLDALAQVGGLIEGADHADAVVLRAGVKEPEHIALSKLLDDGDVSQNVELRGGDTLVFPEALRITIAGEVGHPDSYNPGKPVTLLDALLRSGGFTAQAGLKYATITGHDGKITPVDLEALWRQGDLTKNLTLKPGDIIMVPRANPEEILLTGAVGKTGSFDMADHKDRSLLKILSAMGKVPNADWSRVSIYRDGSVYVYNVRRALELGDMKQNPTLLAGDVVYVPDLQKIILLGAFGRVGAYDFDPKYSIMDYIAMAGGVGNAYEDRGLLIRPLPDGTTETVRLDISKLKSGQLPEKVKLRPGDILYWPPRENKRDWQSTVRDLLYTVGAIIGLRNL
jgi:polysaccharide biosynthesis/export protein